MCNESTLTLPLPWFKLSVELFKACMLSTLKLVAVKVATILSVVSVGPTKNVILLAVVPTAKFPAST